MEKVTQSLPSELVDGLFQLAMLLPQRDDGKFYHGIGDLFIKSCSRSKYTTIGCFKCFNCSTGYCSRTECHISALGLDELQNFNSVLFAGPEVVLIHRSSQPFTASYSIVGETVDPEPLTQ